MINNDSLRKINQIVLDHSVEGIFIMDSTTRILSVNASFCKISGYEMQDLIGLSPDHFLSDQHAQDFYNSIWKSMEYNDAWTGQVWNKRRTGEEYPAWLTIRQIRTDGMSTFYLGMLFDISSLEYLPGATLVINGEGMIVYANQISAEFFGEKSVSQLLGADLVSFMDPKTKEMTRKRIRNAIHGSANGIVEGQLTTKDGVIRYYEGISFPIIFTGTRYIEVVFKDVTERIESREALHQLAYYDTTTKLPNRTSLREQIMPVIQELSQRPGSKVATLFIGVSGLLFVKNMYTNAIGEKLIKEVVERIQKNLRNEDLLYRYSERDFIAIVTYHNDINELVNTIEQTIEYFRQPFNIEGTEYRVHVNIGVNAHIDPNGYIKAPAKEAYMAFLRARERGKNTYMITSPNLNAQAYRRFTLQKDLYGALDRGEMELYYQPRVDPITYQILSAEALIRWNHPTLGMVSPGEFIPLAEESDLIIELGEWVLRTACQQNKHWQDRGLCHLPISVNVSGEQMMKSDFIEKVKRIIEETGIGATWIEIEVTESIFVIDPEQFLHSISELRKLGLNIALDDFGTGYSSLQRLKEIKCNIVKVDQSFVRQMHEHPEDMIIVETVIKLSHSLGMHVVAEGVETIPQFQFLKSNFCDEIQGYLFSRPVPQKEFESLITNGIDLPL